MRLPMLLLISCALPLSACSSPPPKNTEEPPQAVVDPIPTGMGNGTKCNPEALKVWWRSILERVPPPPAPKL